MKYSGIGGQAVIEGVMMRNGDRYALACRRESGELVVREHAVGREISRPVKHIPLLRGFFAFIDSLVIGIKVLNESSDIYLEEETGESGGEDAGATPADQPEKKSAVTTLVTVLSMLLGLVLAFGLFTVLPSFLSGLIPCIEHHFTLRAAVEGVVRILIFIGYLWLISRMKDIQRVFCYHGAEHKSINCVEADLPLTVENVRGCPRAHRRCGTSVLFFVVIVSKIGRAHV